MNESNRSTNHPADAHRKKQFQPPAAKALPRLALASSRQSRRRTRLQEFGEADLGPPCEETQSKRERTVTAQRCHLFVSQIQGRAEFEMRGRAPAKNLRKLDHEPGLR